MPHGRDLRRRKRAAARGRGAVCQALGLAFQIRDDMLDVISTEAELGKPIGSDAREGKNTFMALYGLERCGAMCTSCPSKRQQLWTVCLRTAHFCSSSPARWQIGKTESIKTPDFR